MIVDPFFCIYSMSTYFRDAASRKYKPAIDGGR